MPALKCGAGQFQYIIFVPNILVFRQVCNVVGLDILCFSFGESVILTW